MIETQLNKKSIERCFEGPHDYMKVSGYKEYDERLYTLKILKNDFERHSEGANEKVEQLGRIERGIIEELAFDQKLKEIASSIRIERIRYKKNLNGVSQYWIVDIDKQEIKVYKSNVEKEFRIRINPIVGSDFEFAGKKFDLADFFKK